MTIPESRVRVDLGSRGYDAVVGAGLLDSLGERVTRSAGSGPGSRVLVAADDGLPTQTVSRATRALEAASLKPILHRVRALETEKTFGTLEQLLAAMAGHALDRREPVVALGGGIVGDLAGFAAAIYRRGVPVVQCPTTLLAMVDASIGGKTGVNLLVQRAGTPELQKNMAGAFHQPRLVVADVEALRSLPDRVFRAGLAECLKHGMIAADFGDPGLFDWTESALARILARDAATLAELVTRNVRVKAAVVGRDEREEADEGGRALLNLGHTFGHAIETLPDLSPDGNPASAPLQHGEAVALGLVAAAACAAAAGRCPPELVQRVKEGIHRAGQPTAVRGLPPTDGLIRRMMHDKKVLAGQLRLVLPAALGRAAVVADAPREAVAAGIDAIRA
jgi:3-dehydroquinate synthetase